MASALLNQWHIQCIHKRLDTNQQKSRYIARVNIALSQIWDSEDDELHQQIDMSPPAMLEVEEISNCKIAHRGVSKDAVRLRFRLSSTPLANDEAVHRSVKYFCLKVFELKAKGEIFSLIRSFSTHSLLGIEPLSQIFRLWWTRGFLQTFVHKHVSIFNPLADAEIYTPWLRAVALVYVSAGTPQSTNLIKAIGIAIKNNICPELRTTRDEDERESKMRAKQFKTKVEKLLRELGEASEACVVQNRICSEDLPSDYELQLFETVFEVLQLGFDVLTMNTEIYNQWVEIVSSADAKVKVAGYTTAAALGVSVSTFVKGYYAGAAATTATTAAATTATTVAATTATTATANASAMSVLASSSVLGPLGLCAAGACLTVMHLHFSNKANAQMNKKKRETEELQALHHSCQELGQWLIIFSKPGSADDDDDDDDDDDGVGLHSQEMQELRSKFHDMGLRPAYSLNDWQATLDDERNKIKMQLTRMEKDPACQHMFV